MDHFEHNFDGDEHDDDPLEPGAVFVAQVVVDHVHHLEAVVQLLVHNLSSLGHRQVATGGQEQRLEVLPVPVEVGGVEQVRGEVQQVSQAQNLPGLLQHELLLYPD